MLLLINLYLQYFTIIYLDVVYKSSKIRLHSGSTNMASFVDLMLLYCQFLIALLFERIFFLALRYSFWISGSGGPSADVELVIIHFWTHPSRYYNVWWWCGGGLKGQVISIEFKAELHSMADEVARGDSKKQLRKRLGRDHLARPFILNTNQPLHSYCFIYTHICILI